MKIVNNFFPDSSKQGTAVALVGVFRFLIILMGTFISLEIMNFSGFLWKFIGSLGVAGVIAGVALKDLVSSIFSGMLVGIDKSFKVGDYITLGAHSGTVTEIGFLTTKLINDEGKRSIFLIRLYSMLHSIISPLLHSEKLFLILIFRPTRIYKSKRQHFGSYQKYG